MQNGFGPLRFRLQLDVGSSAEWLRYLLQIKIDCVLLGIAGKRWIEIERKGTARFAKVWTIRSVPGVNLVELAKTFDYIIGFN